MQGHKYALSHLGVYNMIIANLRYSTYVRNGRYHREVLDVSSLPPVVLSGYSYPLPLTSGQVAEVPGKPGMTQKERSFCVIRQHHSTTTVNGICLACAQSKGIVRL